LAIIGLYLASYRKIQILTRDRGRFSPKTLVRLAIIDLYLASAKKRREIEADYRQKLCGGLVGGGDAEWGRGRGVVARTLDCPDKPGNDGRGVRPPKARR
jgi:hypothetical protein